MLYIKFFKDLTKNSVSMAGGKGASLGEMENAGFPIPGGFVILSPAFEEFVKENNLNLKITQILKTVDTNKSETSEKASKDIQNLILNGSLNKNLEKEILDSFKQLNSEFVAVRSSATAEDSTSDAWAGQLDSFLNTNESKLLENVKKCFASLFTERAIIYRIEKGLLEKNISVAVVVQKMVNSDRSGIAFSVNPVTNDYTQMIIEAGYGLGEAIVSGQITPDSYNVSKTHEILDKHRGTQEKALYRSPVSSGNVWKELSSQQKNTQVLSDKEIIELSKIITNIEKHYGFPVDIEWAIENEKIFITQSRPITTLEPRKHKMIKLFTQEHSIFYSYIRKEAEYNNIKKYCGVSLEGVLDIYLPKTNIIVHYYRDDLTEQTNSFLSEKYKQDNDYFKKVKKDIYEYWDKVGPYLQKQKKVETIDELKQFYKDMIDYHTRVAVINVTPDAYVLPQEARDFCLDIRKETQFFVEGYDEVMLDFFNKKYPEYNDIIYHMLPEEIFSLEKRKLTEKELAAIKDRKDNGYIFFRGKVSPYRELSKIIKESDVSIPDSYYKTKIQREHSRAYSFFRILGIYKGIMNLYKTVPIPQKEMCFIFRGDNVVDVYYGLDQLKELFYEICKVAIEKPEIAKSGIKEFYEKFNILKTYLDGKKVQDTKELKDVFETYGDFCMFNGLVYIYPNLEIVPEEIRTLSLEAREKTQEYHESIESIFFDFFESHYPDLKDNYRFILPEEIWNNDIANREEILKRVNERKKGYILYANKLYLGDINKNLEELGLSLDDYDGSKVEEIKGQIAFKGKITGIVRIITSQKQISEFKEGEILVSPMTMPNYLPAIKKASAIVTDEGGITCHASIISRELKKPCVIGTKIATQVLKTGDKVEVDAENGIVRLI